MLWLPPFFVIKCICLNLVSSCLDFSFASDSSSIISVSVNLVFLHLLPALSWLLHQPVIWCIFPSTSCCLPTSSSLLHLSVLGTHFLCFSVFYYSIFVCLLCLLPFPINASLPATPLFPPSSLLPQCCVFSSRLMGRGHYVFDRRWDRMRLALQNMVEKHLNAQMWRWARMNILNTLW